MYLDDNLLNLIETDLGAPLRRSGRWHFFRCPFHEDRTPSLGVTSANNRWYCFSCQRGGGVNTWLREYRRLPARERSSVPPVPPPAMCNTHAPPPAAWQARAAERSQAWEEQLWATTGEKARNWLLGRGLKAEILRKHHLGFNPQDAFEPAQEWGLGSGGGGEEKNRAIWIPRGITIPWQHQGIYWKINIRRAAGVPKYAQIRGSQAAIFGLDGLDGRHSAVFVEGEFDAMLLEQQAGDLAGVVTLGSASARIHLSTFAPNLLHLHRIFVAYDLDPAGTNGALALAVLTARIRQLRAPRNKDGDKDLTDFWKSGGNLRQWLAFEMARWPG